MCRKSKSKRGSLGCWTSAIEADVYRTGELVSKRMDVLISRDFSVSKGTSISLPRNRLHFPCCQPSSRYCSYFDGNCHCRTQLMPFYCCSFSVSLACLSSHVK